MPDRSAPGAASAEATPADEPRIVAAEVSAGHDGQAELVVRVRFENGAIGSVTLNALFAQKLLDECHVDRVDDLIGQPCRRLLELTSTNSH